MEMAWEMPITGPRADSCSAGAAIRANASIDECRALCSPFVGEVPVLGNVLRRSMARILYCTATHTWLRLHRQAVTGGLLAARSAWRAELGVTQRGYDDIGDVVAVTQSAALGRVETGAELFRLEWEGHSVSTADELYHTTWDIVEREHIIRTPLPATLLELCLPTTAVGTSLSPRTVLATLHVDRPALQASSLVDEKRYLEHISQLQPGMFADSSLHEQHSIGGAQRQ